MKTFKVICPSCAKNETEIDSYAGILLCMECAIKSGEKIDRVELINRSEW